MWQVNNNSLTSVYGGQISVHPEVTWLRNEHIVRTRETPPNFFRNVCWQIFYCSRPYFLGPLCLTLLHAFICLWHSNGALATGQRSKTLTEMTWAWARVGTGGGRGDWTLAWWGPALQGSSSPTQKSTGIIHEVLKRYIPIPQAAEEKPLGTNRVMPALSTREGHGSRGPGPTWQALPKNAHLFPPNPCQVSSTLTQCFPSQTAWKAA